MCDNRLDLTQYGAVGRKIERDRPSGPQYGLYHLPDVATDVLNFEREHSPSIVYDRNVGVKCACRDPKCRWVAVRVEGKPEWQMRDQPGPMALRRWEDAGAHPQR